MKWQVPKIANFPAKIVPNFEFIILFVIDVTNKSVTQLFFVSTLYTMLRKYGERPFYIEYSSSVQSLSTKNQTKLVYNSTTMS